MSRSLSILAAVIAAATAALLSLPGIAHRDEVCPAHFLGGREPSIAAARNGDAVTLCFSDFALRYSGRTKTAIWSAEHLTADRVRQASNLMRKGNFHEEPRVPDSWKSRLKDYKRSGYDRGHLSPSGDMSTRQAQDESFSLANMIPQHPCSNEGIWAGLESSVRTVALRQGEIFVVTGPIYSGGKADKTIGSGVAVPDAVFKAVYDPVTGLAGAYVAQNSETSDLQTMSVADLEGIAGVAVFPSLSEAEKSEMLPLPAPEKSKYRCRLPASRRMPG